MKQQSAVHYMNDRDTTYKIMYFEWGLHKYILYI